MTRSRDGLEPAWRAERFAQSVGYLRRMRVYFREMFSLPTHLLLAALVYLAIATFARRVHGIPASLLSWHTGAGIVTVFDVFLMLRLMDDLKDRDIDPMLFPTRPLASGRVFESDVRGTLATALIVYVLVASMVGQAIWSALVVLAYLMLMFRLFFVPELLRRSLPLALATHAPILPLLLLHGFAIFADEQGLALSALQWSLIIPFVAMIWAVFESWELARKIRASEEETAYVTYSKVLGPRRAVAAVIVLQGVAAAIALFLGGAFGVTWLDPVLVLFGLTVAQFGNFRFLLAPLPRNARLRPFTESFMTVFLCAQVIGFGARSGGV